jgi:hypothetical protein
MRALLSLRSALALLLPVTPALAQSPPRGAEPPHLTPAHSAPARLAADTVTGLVYDSLAREVLVGAIVVARPRLAAALTDSTGRFDLISDERVESLVVHHPSLDAVGLDAIGAVRPQGAGAWREVRLATPSLATVWRRECADAAPPRDGDGRGMLVGSARLAAPSVDTTAGAAFTGPVLLAGARVQAGWSRLPGPDTTTVRATRSDARGTWALCDVPLGVELALAADSREAASGALLLPADARPLRRVDLVLGAVGDGAPGDGAPATGVVRGRVVDETGFPVEGARVTVAGAPGPGVEASRWGEFVIAGAPAGSRMLAAQAVGHAPVAQAVTVESRDSDPITLVLPRLASLDRMRASVRISVRDSVRPERAEFERRRRSGQGFIADSAALQRASGLGAVLRQVPGLEVQVAASSARGAGGLDLTGSRVNVRGVDGCRVHVFLDGRSVTLARLNAVRYESLAGLEVYAGRSETPERFATQLRGRDCAVLLGWSVRALRP